MTYRTAPPRDVLVVASHKGVIGLDAASGRAVWHVPPPAGWGTMDVRVARIEGGVVAVCAHTHVLWVRVEDGAVLGTDSVWFLIENVLNHEDTLVISGLDGMVCYRAGVRAWGVRVLPKHPGALLGTDYVAWLTDAAGNPTSAIESFPTYVPAALVLGTTVAQIDRHGG